MGSFSIASLGGSALSVIGAIIFFMMEKNGLGWLFVILAIVLAIIAALGR